MNKRDKEKDSGFEEEMFSDKWGMLKSLTNVESDIKSDITRDFILAKLTDHQREAVIELVRDAYFYKKMIDKYAENGCTFRVDKRGIYEKNSDGTYKRFPLSNIVQKYIKNVGKIGFNSYMIKVTMTVIMYRNIEQNTLMEMMTERDRMNEENDALRRENDDIINRMKKNVKKGERDEE